QSRWQVRLWNVDKLDVAAQQALDIGDLAVAAAGVVALLAQKVHDRRRARGGVETDRIAGTTTARWIVGQDHCKAPPRPRRARQPPPGRRQTRDIVDPVEVRLMTHSGEL